MRVNPNQIDRKKEPGPPTKPKPKRARQSQQQPVEVYCRLRPLKPVNSAPAVRPLRSSTELQVCLDGSSNGQVYKFKKVFHSETTQSVVFEEVAFPLVGNLINGENGLLFTYGVTSSGKTFTVTGEPKFPGILPRTLDVLFNTLDKNNLQSRKYVIKPDGYNGFEINSSPDAILRLQVETGTGTPYSTPLSTPYKQPLRTPRSVVKTVDWSKRERESHFVNEINCDNNYAVFISYVEVYNNFIYDLLDESPDIAARQTPGRLPMRLSKSRILEDPIRNVQYVLGVVEVEVKNANEAYDLYLKGVGRRTSGSTDLNSESSRSHAIFTIRLVQAPLDINGTELVSNKKYIHVSQLAIVDLAGSERCGRTNAVGNRLREGNNINNSLMTLRQCFEALREKQKGPNSEVIPYRDSKLTKLFRSYFEGEGAVKMIICLNPSVMDFAESLSVLKFGEQSQEILTAKGRGARAAAPVYFDEDYCTPLSFGPSYPKRYLEEAEDERIIPEWISVAEQRKEALRQARIVHERRLNDIRRAIANSETENAQLKQENSHLRMDLEAREAQLKDYENKVLQQKRELDSRDRQNSELKKTNSDTYYELQLKENICIVQQREIENMRSSMNEHLKKEKERLKKWCHEMLNQKEEDLKRMKCLNQDKLNLATKILMGEGDGNNVLNDFNLLSPPRSAFDISKSVQPSILQQVQTQPKTLASVEPQTATATFTPHGPPVVNPRFGTGPNAPNDKWIEHIPPGTIELGTILQPIFKNRKSVTNLKPSDFKNKNITKYAVTHNIATESGNIETEVYKGDVVPSVTGGAQIIFNDVEVLKQGSPMQMGLFNRKRTATTDANGNVAVESEPGTSTATSTPTTAPSTTNKRPRRRI